MIQSKKATLEICLKEATCDPASLLKHLCYGSWQCIFSPSNLFCVLFYVVVSPHVGLTLLFLGTKDTLSSSKKRHGCGKTIKMVCFILFESRSLCRTNVNSEGILKAVTNARQKKSHSFQLSVEHVSFKYELHGLNLTSISKQ